VKIHTPQFSLLFYPQDPDYNISHIIWHFNALINKNAPKNKKIQFTASPALTPVLVVEKVWRSNGVRLYYYYYYY
jgi:hypothetical protein